jgi:hypothetical protein
MYIPIFSINYASSSFCLEELVHIMHGFKEKGRLVLPVFYGADPSEVWHQNRAIIYASSLPLVIDAIGSNWLGKDIEEWESILDKYKRIPPEDIQKN